jgi:hypothetical protein
MLSNFASHITSLRCVATPVGQTLLLICDWLVRLVSTSAARAGEQRGSKYVQPLCSRKTFRPAGARVPDGQRRTVRPRPREHAPSSVVSGSNPLQLATRMDRPCPRATGGGRVGRSGLVFASAFDCGVGRSTDGAADDCRPDGFPHPRIAVRIHAQRMGRVQCDVRRRLAGSCSPLTAHCFVSLSVLLPSRPLV